MHSYNTSLDKPLFGTYNCKEFEKVVQVLNNKTLLENWKIFKRESSFKIESIASKYFINVSSLLT